MKPDVISETDIVAGYLWILGRMPNRDEIASCRAHFSFADPELVRTFQQSLLRSEEFRNRRLLLLRQQALIRPELDQDRLAFVHIEKCGGTTLHAMLATQFVPERVCPERDSSLGDWTINELAGFGLFSGHFDLSCCRSIPGRLRVLTMLREPRARLFSLYRFWKSHRPHPERDRFALIPLARALDAAAFFAHEEVRHNTVLRDGMTGQLTRSRGEWSLGAGHALIDDPVAMVGKAMAVLENMAGFGILERFEDSRRLLNHNLGLRMPEILPLQVLDRMAHTDPELAPLPPEPITPEVDALLDAMTTVDRPVYASAVSLFRSRLATLDAGNEATAVATPSPRPRWARSFVDGAGLLRVGRRRSSTGRSQS